MLEIKSRYLTWVGPKPHLWWCFTYLSLEYWCPPFEIKSTEIALDYYVPTYLDLLVGFSAHIYYTDWIALLKSIDLDSKDSDGQVREYD